MDDLEKIKVAWARSPAWDFVKNGPLHVPEPFELPPVTIAAADEPDTAPIFDHVVFSMEYKGGVRAAVHVIGRLRKTSCVVHFERH